MFAVGIDQMTTPYTAIANWKGGPATTAKKEMTTLNALSTQRRIVLGPVYQVYPPPTATTVTFQSRRGSVPGELGSNAR